MKYKVEVREILSRIIEIEAENEEGSLKEVKRKYMNENFILNAEDYVKTEFNSYKD